MTDQTIPEVDGAQRNEIPDTWFQGRQDSGLPTQSKNSVMVIDLQSVVPAINRFETLGKGGLFVTIEYFNENFEPVVPKIRRQASDNRGNTLRTLLAIQYI